jgi:hypothetical protein
MSSCHIGHFGLRRQPWIARYVPVPNAGQDLSTLVYRELEEESARHGVRDGAIAPGLKAGRAERLFTDVKLRRGFYRFKN